MIEFDTWLSDNYEDLKLSYLDINEVWNEEFFMEFALDIFKSI